MISGKCLNRLGARGSLAVASASASERAGELSESEMMAIVIHFHPSGYRTFKGYFLRSVTAQLRLAFPRLVSYPRFVEMMQAALIPQ